MSDPPHGLASGLVVGGIVMILAGVVLGLVVGSHLDWLGAFFAAWGVAGGAICLGNAAIAAFGRQARTQPVP